MTSVNLNIDISILIILILIVFSVMYFNKDPGVCEYDPILNRLIKDAKLIEPRSAELEFFTSDESYTEDKKRIFLCLKDKNNQYYSYNHLIQVLIHELAHAFCSVIDKEHKTDEFNNLHLQYRKTAESKNLVDLSDPVPPTYCRY